MTTVRRAHWTDHAGVKLILDDFARLHHGLDPGLFRPRVLGFTQAIFQGFLDQPSDIHLVAERDGALAGYLWAGLGQGNESMFTFARRNLFIGVLAVSKDHRRRGIGRRLFAAIEAQARDFDAEIVQLNVAPGNVVADAFYDSMGYPRSSETRTRVLKSPLRPA